MQERRAAKNLIFPKWAGIAHSQAEQGCKYSFNRIMRLSDQQQLEIRSLPSQCMRSKFLPLLPWPTRISPLSSCRDDPAVALQSLGHPTPPGHFATCSWGSLMLFYHQVTTEQLRLQFGVEALLKRDFFFKYNCGQNWVEIHLNNRDLFKCCHWALLYSIHVQAQNFQQ